MTQKASWVISWATKNNLNGWNRNKITNIRGTLEHSITCITSPTRILIRLSEAIRAQALPTKSRLLSSAALGFVWEFFLSHFGDGAARAGLENIRFRSDWFADATKYRLSSPATGSRRAPRVSFRRRTTWAQKLGRSRQRGWRSSRMQTISWPARWGLRRFCDPVMWIITMWIKELLVIFNEI